MKLIRLVSTKDDYGKSAFINIFQNEILIKPDSKIALVSAVIPRQNEAITIDNSNDAVDFQMAVAATKRSLKVPSGSYTLSSLYQALNIALNAKLQSDIYEIYSEFNVSNTSQLETSIGIYRSLSLYKGITSTSGQYQNLDIPSTGLLEKTAGVADNWDAYFVTDDVICKGSSVMRAGVPTAGLKAFIGLTDDEQKGAILSANSAVPTNCIYGIYVHDGQYDIIINKVVTPTNVAASADNDIVELKIYGGKIYAAIYGNLNTQNVKFVLSLGDYDFSDLYGVYSIFTKDGKLGIAPTGTAKPNALCIFQNTLINPVGNYSTTALEPAGAKDRSIGKVTITLSSGLGRTLGYENLTYSTTKAIDYYIGAYTPQNTETVPSILIRMNDIDLDSFDGDTGTVGQIVGVIPALTELNEDMLAYEAKLYQWININNLKTWRMNRFSIQLESFEGKDIKLAGRASFVFMIDEP